MGKQAPEAPNPNKVAAAQTSTNVATAVANSWLQNADTYTPFGSTTYDVTGRRKIFVPGAKGRPSETYYVPTFSVTQKLSDDQQALLNLQEEASRNLGRTAVNESEFLKKYLSDQMDTSHLPQGVQNAASAQNLQVAQSPEDFSQDRSHVEDALYSRLNPQLQRDRQAMETRLANQGVTQGSEAYRNAMDELNRQSNDARMQVVTAGGAEQDRLYNLALQKANQANEVTQGNFQNKTTTQQNQQTLREQALQELMALRNQPLSEVSQLLHGSSPTIPQFQSFQPGTIANTPVGDYYYKSAQMNQQNAAMQQQSTNAMLGGLFGLGGSLFGLYSDRRLKENVEPVGKLKNGLTIYAYNFNGNPRTEIGLMADEVEAVMPEAVMVDPATGFKKVNYAMAVA